MKNIWGVILMLTGFTMSAQELRFEEIQAKCTQIPDGKYIIDNQKDYQALLDNRSPHPECSTYRSPEIDFNKYTLVGFAVSVKGCQSPVSSLSYSDDLDSCHVTLNITTYGLCKRRNRIKRWLLIPNATAERLTHLNIEITEE